MNAKPKRRWYQFSLRTMFIVMVLSSVAFGYWVHWSKEWIRLRHEWLQHHNIDLNGALLLTKEPIRAPCGLWVFGEKGVPEINLIGSGDQFDVLDLFPEATVSVVRGASGNAIGDLP